MEKLQNHHHPLFSTLISFFIIILFFFPNHFTKIAFSPVLVSTTILLITLLRLGTTQNTLNKINFVETRHTRQSSPQKDPVLAPIETNREKKAETEPNALFYSFVGWNVRAPLEVIYEEEDEFGYPLMYLYCSESDSNESSSDMNFPTTGECFWEDEDEKEGLIEIELNGKTTNDLFEFEEENLIEIDISPTMVSF